MTIRGIFIVLAGLLLARPVFPASFDCAAAYTPLEQAICDNPLLDSLDFELARLSEQALALQLISLGEIRHMRNQVARRCRQVDDLVGCLVDVERQNISLLAAKLGQPVEVAASSKSRLPSQAWAGRVVDATESFRNAEAILTHTQEPRLAVFAGLTLLQIYREREPWKGDTNRLRDKTHALERKLMAGCNSRVYGNKWRMALERHGRSCTAVRTDARDS